MTTDTDIDAKKSASKTLRKRLFTILASVVAFAVAAWLIYWVTVGQNHVVTDDAYVDANVAQITPLISGQVAKVLVTDTQNVQAGQPLVVIDDADAQVALAQAQAQFSQAERRVRGYFANANALSGQVAARDAEIARANAQIAAAQADTDRAATELGRRERLAASGAVSGDELTQAQNQSRTAKAALESARAGRALAVANRGGAVGTQGVNSALISGSSIEGNPEVAAARANLRAAQLGLARTVLRAPFDGVVAKKDVAIGQHAQVGSVLMSVVPVAQVFVNANFKEVQLRKVKLGQRVTLTSDIYGRGVKFHGVVAGVSGGTGSAFSLIPAQNATGNWIKVVQRLPLRVTLDAADLRSHPLRVGLSMSVDIDVSSR